MTYANDLTQFQIVKDFSFSIGTSQVIQNYVLTANTAKTIDLSIQDANGNRAARALFVCTDKFYARYDGEDAAIPGSDVVDGTGSELNPTQRTIQNLDSMSVIAPADCILTVTLYTY